MPFPGLVCKNLPHVLLQALSLHPGRFRLWWRRDRGAWVPEWLRGVQPHPPCSAALCWTTTCLYRQFQGNHRISIWMAFWFFGNYHHWSCVSSRSPSFSSHLTGSSLHFTPSPVPLELPSGTPGPSVSVVQSIQVSRWPSMAGCFQGNHGREKGGEEIIPVSAAGGGWALCGLREAGKLMASDSTNSAAFFPSQASKCSCISRTEMARGW